MSLSSALSLFHLPGVLFAVSLALAGFDGRSGRVPVAVAAVVGAVAAIVVDRMADSQLVVATLVALVLYSATSTVAGWEIGARAAADELPSISVFARRLSSVLVAITGVAGITSLFAPIIFVETGYLPVPVSTLIAAAAAVVMWLVILREVYKSGVVANGGVLSSTEMLVFGGPYAAIAIWGLTFAQGQRFEHNSES